MVLLFAAESMYVGEGDERNASQPCSHGRINYNTSPDLGSCCNEDTSKLPAKRQREFRVTVGRERLTDNGWEGVPSRPVIAR